MKDCKTLNKKEILFCFTKYAFITAIIFLIMWFTGELSFKFIPDIRLFGGYLHFIIYKLLNFVIILVLFLLIKKNNNDLLTKKKFINSISKGWPIFFVVLPVLSFDLYTIIFINKEINYYGIFGLFCYCFVTGLLEEFTFRKWIQNEFIGRFGDKNKGVIISIILSSFLFGIMHFMNIDNHSLLNTVMQVFYAFSFSIVVGEIFYKTNNLWSAIWIHTIYDFIIFLDAEIPMTGYTIVSSSINIDFIITIWKIVCIVIYVIYAVQLLQRNDNNKIITNYNESKDVLENQTSNKMKYFLPIFILLAINFVLYLLYIALQIK